MRALDLSQVMKALSSLVMRVRALELIEALEIMKAQAHQIIL